VTAPKYALIAIQQKFDGVTRTRGVSEGEPDLPKLRRTIDKPVKHERAR